MKPKKPSGQRVELYRDRKGEYRIRAFARNGRVVGTSEEGFTKRAWAIKRAAARYPNWRLYEKGEFSTVLTPLAPKIAENEEQTEETYTGSRADA